MTYQSDPGITANELAEGESRRTVPETEVEYLCPGDTRPISPAVHYARLAAFFPKCRLCVHRRETGSLPRQIVERIDRTLHRVPRETLLTREGVRGAHLNEFGPREVSQFAAAFAHELWKQQPRRCSSNESGPSDPARRLGPVVVLGRDSRVSSPSLVVEAAAALRSAGCRVIDVGIVSGPCMAFAVDHLDAAGGLHVTGSGCGPSFNGLDFWEANAVPWSQPGQLGCVDSRSVPRPTRQGGDQQSFQAEVPYSASLLKHFHALRPLRIAVGCGSNFVREQFSRIFSQLPGHAEFVSVSTSDDVERSRALTLDRTVSIVRDGGLHFGAVIDDDAQTCRFLDETGRIIPAPALTAQFARLAREETESPKVVVDESLASEFTDRRSAEAPPEICREATREAMARCMVATAADLGVESGDRYWFRGDYPICDAIITTARLLQALSRSDRPCSELFVDN